METAESNRQLIGDLLKEFDVSQTGQLEAEEAEQLFTKLARQLLSEAATNGKGAAAAHAQGLLDAEDACETENADRLCTTISEMAGHLLKIADRDGDGIVSLEELAELFEGGSLLGAGSNGDDPMAQLVDRPSTLELYELRGCLQMLPRIARHFDSSELLGESWHDNVAGDSHVMMRWVSPTHAKDGLSIVGLGRSADASCYYLPEWGIVLDAGLATKAFTPKTVLLTHSHRDHMQALPVLARAPPFGRSAQGRKHAPHVVLPAPLEPLVRNFLFAESVLNFGHPQSVRASISIAAL
jgi:ribonuclease Z